MLNNLERALGLYQNIWQKLSLLSVILFLILNVFASSLLAQKLTSSPYSRYGIGEVQPQGFAHNMSLGRGGVAIDSNLHINTLNPATFSSIQFTTFEGGALSNTVNYINSDSGSLHNNTSISYLALGIPIKKWWGLSFGLIPYSSVGYHVSDTVTQDNIGRVAYDYQGRGGINNVYLGNGFRWKNLSFGLSAGYYFGTIRHTRKVYFLDVPNAFNLIDNNESTVGDFNFTYGIHYKFKLDSIFKPKKPSGLQLGVGVRYDQGMSVNAKRNILTQTFGISGSGLEIGRDTINYVSAEKGKIEIPQGIAFGLVLQKGQRWMMVADYSMQDWSKFFNYGASDSLYNSYKGSIGFQYTPKAETGKGFFRHTIYRLGTYYHSTPLQLRSTAFEEYGVTAGFGFPIVKAVSTLNVGIDLGQRGTTENNLIQEKYIRVTIGLTLNEHWFQRRQID